MNQAQESGPVEDAVELSEERVLELTRQLVVENGWQFVRAIEARTGVAAAEVLQSIRQLLARTVGIGNSVDRRPPITSVPVTVDRLERYAPLWASIVPAHAELRATTSLLLERQYGINLAAFPALAEAFSLSDPAVMAARAEFAGAAGSADEPQRLSDEPPETDDRRKLEGAVEQEVRVLKLTKGDVLSRQGEEPRSLFLVLSGRLQVSVADDNGLEHAVNEIGPGSTAGETEVLTHQPWPVSVRALRDSTAIALDIEACQRLIQSSPRVLMAVTDVVLRRLREYQTASTRNQLAPRTITILPLHPGVPAGELATMLAEELGKLQPTSHIRRETAEVALEELADSALIADTYDERLVSWLNQQEARFPFVVYEADAELNGWTTRCLRQADRIMLLAWSGDDASLSPVERALAEAPEGSLRENVDLVLLQAESASHPAGTHAWLEPRSVRSHHHIRRGSREDVGYLVRRLTAEAVGVVLGGGGARAFAAIGALRAIREAGVPIDLIGGTSAGAFFAAGYAIGWDHETMVEIARDFLGSRRSRMDYTFPMVSLLSAKQMRRGLQALFGDTLIEDLWRPFFCVSSNLSRAEMMVHRSGLLRHYVRASCSVPSVFPPVLEDNDLLVDGMLLNNLPVDVMSHISQGGPIIAIDVSAKAETTREFRFGDSLSAGQLLLSKLHPNKAERLVAPSILDVILRTSEVASIYTRKAQARNATVYVAPPVSEYGLFEMGKLDELIQAGYDSTHFQVRAWLDAQKQAAAAN